MKLHIVHEVSFDSSNKKRGYSKLKTFAVLPESCVLNWVSAHQISFLVLATF